MNPLVGALVLILLGLLGAKLSFTTARAPLGPRLIFSAGTHFLFFGFLLGSNGLGLLSRPIIDQLYPFLALGLGWVGLLFGLQLERRQIARFGGAYVAIALGQAVIAYTLIFALGALLILTAARPTPPVIATLLATSATACISTPAGIALISKTFLVQGKVSRLLFFIASIDAIVGIAALQFAYALYHPGELQAGGLSFPVALWIAIALGLGIFFGFLFLWFTRRKPQQDELVLFLLGLVVFAAGTAFYLGLSPLFVTVTVGAVVANFSPLRRRIYSLLQAWEQPIYVILLVLAGALLDFSTWAIVPLAIAYLVVRMAAKLAGGFLITRALPGASFAPPTLGLGLVPQGGISLAMAISITLTYEEFRLGSAAGVELLFGTVVIGVVMSELIGPLLTRNLLRGVGEILPRVESALAGGRDRSGPDDASPDARDTGGSDR